MAGFLMAEALRDLWRAGRIAVSAVMLIALSLAALGGFWLLSSNVGRAVAQWRDRVRVTVYLRREPTTNEVPALVARVRALPGVAAVRYVDPATALLSLKRTLGKDAAVADQLPSNPLPASLEITATPAAATPEAARALNARLAELPDVEEVAGSLDWVEQLARWQRLATTIGLGISAVLAIAAILTVTTATTLVLHARRQETEIMRLVGAPEFVVRLPLLLQGMLQGLIGAALALAGLAIAHHLVAPRLGPLVNLTLGLANVDFLPPLELAALLVAGTVFGAAGGWLARGRA